MDPLMALAKTEGFWSSKLKSIIYILKSVFHINRKTLQRIYSSFFFFFFFKHKSYIIGWLDNAPATKVENFDLTQVIFLEKNNEKVYLILLKEQMAILRRN